MLEPSIRYQTVLGYGQGSMDQNIVPWYERLSEEERTRFLDRLYTLGGDGLGLTICRTYICAGDAPGHSHFDRRPGGRLDPIGYEPKDGEFLWERHEASLWLAQGAAARGAAMVAFWNSPPWWLTVSGCTAGAGGGGSNLLAGKEPRFARHMVDVVEHYRDAWGVPFEAICPINEPEANWWREGGGQDGCHFEADQAAVLIAALDAELRARGLDVRVQAHEAAFGNGVDYLDALLADGAAYDAMADFTCHQYIVSDWALRSWRRRASLHQRPLWMSEWGDWTSHGMDLALSVAGKLHEAHRVMGAEAWCLWEPACLFHEADGRLEPNPGYYAFGQYSRFARPGVRLIEATGATLKTTAYVDEASRTLVIVTVNPTEAAVPTTYDLSAFEGLSEIRAWRTSETERLAELPPLQAASVLAVELPERSITTFTATYTGTAAPLVRNGGFEEGHFDGWQGEPDTDVGVQTNYPDGGVRNGFLNIPEGGPPATMRQRVEGLASGKRYRLTAACASSHRPAVLQAEDGEVLGSASNAPESGYQTVSVEFVAPDGGAVTVRYSLEPAEGAFSWATIDNVRVSPSAQ